MIEKIHLEAREKGQVYLKAEAEVLSIIQMVEERRVHHEKGYPSLFAYVTEHMGLADDRALDFIRVARKAREVPVLKEAIEASHLTISKARRIAPVITRENQDTWLRLAQTATNRQLEKAIAKENPKEAVQERTRYVSEERIKLELGISEELLHKLRRIQDLESQRQRHAVSFEETIEQMAELYLKRNDPLEKAKRVQNSVGTCRVGRGVAQLSLRRKPVPAWILHKVRLRDHNQCTFRDPNNQKRCERKRWLEVHHILPLERGGTNELNNLKTLCSFHHKKTHEDLVRQY